MIELRPAQSHGRTETPSLRSIHHFSFARYWRDGRSSWGRLIALNHMRLKPHHQLGPNWIDGCDIIRIVRRGVLDLSSSLGGRLRTLAGEVEVLSTGAGVSVADLNAGRIDLECYELRLKVLADDDPPSRHVTRFPGRKQVGKLAILASGDVADRGALRLKGAARIIGGRLRGGETMRYRTSRHCHIYATVMSGDVELQGQPIAAGDAAAILGEDQLTISATKGAEVLLVESWK